MVGLLGPIMAAFGASILNGCVSVERRHFVINGLLYSRNGVLQNQLEAQSFYARG